MTKSERNKLFIIFSMPPEQRLHWFHSLEDEAQEYTQHLIDRYKEELVIRKSLTYNYNLSDLSEAKAIIKAIMNKTEKE